MDLSESIIPRSDQINSDDLVMGPQTFTIREVRKGAAESPFDFMLVETERAYRPSKTMRRMIVAAWGSEATNYVGKRLTLYREPSIRFGSEVVGGIRISHMSGIDGRVEGKFQVSRGKRELFTVDPLPDAAATISTETPPAELAQQVADALTAATTEAEVREWGNRAHSRNLLDLDLGVDTTLRELVTKRLAEVGVTAEDAFEDPA